MSMTSARAGRASWSVIYSCLLSSFLQGPAFSQAFCSISYLNTCSPVFGYHCFPWHVRPSPEQKTAFRDLNFQHPSPPTLNPSLAPCLFSVEPIPNWKSALLTHLWCRLWYWLWIMRLMAVAREVSSQSGQTVISPLSEADGSEGTCPTRHWPAFTFFHCLVLYTSHRIL